EAAAPAEMHGEKRQGYPRGRFQILLSEDHDSGGPNQCGDVGSDRRDGHGRSPGGDEGRPDEGEHEAWGGEMPRLEGLRMQSSHVSLAEPVASVLPEQIPARLARLPTRE